MKNEAQRFSSESVRNRLKKIEITDSLFDVVKCRLEQDIFGQEEACEAVARMVTKFESGVNDIHRPAGVLIFLGPTGVGKTEMSKALTKHLFGKFSDGNYKKIDCSEYSEPHTISRFIGSPPSYVGYGDELVIEPGFLNNRNVIVFDEIEKADPALWKMLLSVFDTGVLHARCKLGDKREIEEVSLNFSNSFIILTSNVGARQIQEKQRPGLGFLNHTVDTDVSQAAITGLLSFFADVPEFLGRIDEFIVFKHLKPEHYEQIYWKFIEELNSQLQVRLEINFSTTYELADYLIKQGVADNRYGARNIKHVIDKTLVQPLADVLASHPGIRGMIGDIDDGQVVFYDLTPELPEITPEDNREMMELEELLRVEMLMKENKIRECENKMTRYLESNPDKWVLLDKILADLNVIQGRIECPKGEEIKVTRALSLVANLSGLNSTLAPVNSDEDAQNRLINILEFYWRVTQESQ